MSSAVRQGEVGVVNEADKGVLSFELDRLRSS